MAPGSWLLNLFHIFFTVFPDDLTINILYMKFKHCISILSLLFVLNNCLAQDVFKITHGPYLQNLSDSGVTIKWTTNHEAIAWVELAPDDSTHFYMKERPKYFSTSHGIKNVSTIHSVQLEQLKPGARYRYRIYSREVKEHEGFKVQYGNTIASNVFKQQPYSFSTSDKRINNLSFLIVNDIHGKSDMMAGLLRVADWKKTDMIFFNGDMMSDFRSEEQMFSDFMDTAVMIFAKEKPMYYARGNHETRGQFASEFYKYFPGPNGNLYYLLRQGPVCFVMMDCGEDKPDSDIEYSGITDYEEYRTKQAQWLKEALKDKVFTEAPFKIAVIHMPPFGGWFGELDIANKFVPLLNDAGIQIMFCGHLHKYIHQKPQPNLARFPIIVNSNNTIVKGEIQNNELKVQILNTKGEALDKFMLPVHNIELLKK